MAKSPFTVAVIQRLKKQEGMKDDETDETPADEADDETSTQDEAKLAAAEDAIEAIRSKDAAGLKDAWLAFLDACGVTY